MADAAVAETEAAAETAERRDQLLIARVISGDAEAFECLYECYLPRVYGFVRKRLHNRADVEEAVQDVFLAAFSSLESFRGDAPFGAWLLGIARRTVANRFKKKQHPTVPLEPEEEPQVVDSIIPTLQRVATPLEHYECQERILRIEETGALRLSAEQWQLFELHHLEHHSISDIARATYKSENAVKSNLYRVRRVLFASYS